jgi:hypothetical protein
MLRLDHQEEQTIKEEIKLNLEDSDDYLNYFYFVHSEYNASQLYK